MQRDVPGAISASSPTSHALPSPGEGVERPPADDALVERSSSVSTPSPGARSGRPTYDVIELARYEDIAHRVLMQQSYEEIAAALDLDVSAVRRITRRDAFRAVYLRVKDAVYSDLEGLIKDEKAAPVLRLKAASVRAQTLVGEVMEEVRERINNGTARSMDLKVATEAAFGLLDRAHPELRVRGAGTPTVNFNFASGTAATFKGAVRESGIDLSDLRDYIDAEVVEVVTDADADADATADAPE